MILQTERIILRPFKPEDIDDLAALYADGEVRRYFPDGALNREETQEELDWFLAGGNSDYPDFQLGAMIERESGAFIGRSGLIAWEIEGRHEVEIAYMVARARWGQDFGAEIAAGLVRYGFETLYLPRLIALIHPENLASQKTAQRAGLHFEKNILLEDGPCRLYSLANPLAALPA